MADEHDDKLAADREWPEILRKVRASTPARLLMGRAGAAYLTATQMDLREAHAAARDAVRAELDLTAALGAEFVERWGLFEVGTRAANKDEYLLRPDLGRHFSDAAREELQRRCARERDFQVAIGDGLSVTAVAAQVPALLPLLLDGAERRGWSRGQPFAIRHCRVGILNAVGDLLAPRVAVLLVGERPGLATAESLSAYMAYRPGAAQTDANRNLISNIHARGLSADHAARRILNLAAQMMRVQLSGCNLREEMPQLKQA